MINITQILFVIVSASGTPLAPASSLPSLPDSLGTITTDTGDFALGPTTFARYRIPGLCLAAAQYTRDVLRRASVPGDVGVSITPQHDTLPTSVVAEARRCGHSFRVGDVAPAVLEDLFQLALIEGADSLAQTVVQRRLALAPTSKERDAVLENTVQDYLAAQPAHIEAAVATAAAVDTLGPAAAVVRLAVHDSLLAFATGTFDTLQMRRQAEQILAIGHEVPVVTIQYDYDAIEHAYEALAAIACMTQSDSFVVIARNAQQDLRRFPPGSALPVDRGDWRLRNKDFQQSSVSDMMRWLTPEAFAEAGTLVSPLQAIYWFPHPSRSNNQGRVSLFLNGGKARTCLHDGFGEWTEDGRDICHQLMTTLPRLLSQYKTQKLAVTVVVDTWGRGLGGLPVPPAEEADTIRWYLLTHLQLPITVAVISDSTVQFPTPDRRRFSCTAASQLVCQDQSANAQRYLKQWTDVLLVGPDNKLLYQGNFGPLFEAVLAHALSSASPVSSHEIGSTR